VLLISAYQPGIVPWEDDQTWLERIRAQFVDDPDVLLTNDPISLSTYFGLMSRLDLMIGMRLHSALIALRYGVPAINISYTLKGAAILKHLGLSENVVDIPHFLESPQLVFERAVSILRNLPQEQEKTREAVRTAVEINMSVLRELLGQGDN
jgi:polysaccharide pyruvyl transferase WcaK-like protein